MLATPVRDALDSARIAIAAAGSDTPDLDAQLLLAHALGVDRAALVMDPDRPVLGEAIRMFQNLVRRRSAGHEPIAYLLGTKGFRHIDVHVDRRVLVPRPETELLVEVGLTLPQGARVHDACTGSGAVALALKQERPDLVVSGSDASADAVDVARANAQRLGLDVSFEVAEGLPEGSFGLVVANLPYVREEEWDALQPEIRLYEPREALVSGADGLDA